MALNYCRQRVDLSPNQRKNRLKLVAEPRG